MNRKMIGIQRIPCGIRVLYAPATIERANVRTERVAPLAFSPAEIAWFKRPLSTEGR